MTQKTAPLFTVQPQFIPRLTVIEAFITALAGTLLLTLVGGTILFMLCALLGISKILPVWFLYFIFFAASVVIIPPLYFELKKKAYAQTQFSFFPDHLEYKNFEWLILPRRGRIKYSAIEGLSRKTNFLQTPHQIESLRLHVPGLPFQSFNRFQGLNLPDILTEKNYGEQIEGLLEK